MKEVNCKKCGYTWNTKSKMAYVSCPSCLQKINIKSIKQSIDEFMEEKFAENNTISDIKREKVVNERRMKLKKP